MLSIKLCGQLYGSCIDFPLERSDLCSYVSCPLQSGAQYVLRLSIPIRSYWQKVGYGIRRTTLYIVHSLCVYMCLIILECCAVYKKVCIGNMECKALEAHPLLYTVYIYTWWFSFQYILYVPVPDCLQFVWVCDHHLYASFYLSFPSHSIVSTKCI